MIEWICSFLFLWLAAPRGGLVRRCVHQLHWRSFVSFLSTNSLLSASFTSLTNCLSLIKLVEGLFACLICCGRATAPSHNRRRQPFTAVQIKPNNPNQSSINFFSFSINQTNSISFKEIDWWLMKEEEINEAARPPREVKPFHSFALCCCSLSFGGAPAAGSGHNPPKARTTKAKSFHSFILLGSQLQSIKSTLFFSFSKRRNGWFVVCCGMRHQFFNSPNTHFPRVCLNFELLAYTVIIQTYSSLQIKLKLFIPIQIKSN